MKKEQSTNPVFPLKKNNNRMTGIVKVKHEAFHLKGGQTKGDLRSGPSKLEKRGREERLKISTQHKTGGV